MLGYKNMFAAPFCSEFSIRPIIILYGGLLKNTNQLFGLHQFLSASCLRDTLLSAESFKVRA